MIIGTNLVGARLKMKIYNGINMTDESDPIYCFVRAVYTDAHGILLLVQDEKNEGHLFTTQIANLYVTNG